jgi:hypothetical protein
MACRLNEKQIEGVYKYLYKDIVDRMGDSRMSKFDIDEAIKTIYNSVLEVDPNNKDQVEKARLFAQAIPDIFKLISIDEDVNEYLVDIEFDANKVNKLQKDFSDIDNVKNYFKTKKKSKAEIEAKIENTNEKRNTISPLIDSGTLLSNLETEDKAKVTSPLTTTIQVAITGNPDSLSESEKDKLDPEKILFSDVVKAIAYIAKNAEQDGVIIYDGVQLALRALQTTQINEEELTTNDRKWIEENPDYIGIAAVISDIQGNPIYFKEDGRIAENPEEGRIVYQWLRIVQQNDNGELLLSNRANRKYNLVTPEVIAEREAERIEEAGGRVTKTQLRQMTKDVAKLQRQQLNQLYTLRQMLENDTEGKLKIVLPILSGTFGITNVKNTIGINEAGLSEQDIKKYNLIKKGKNKGKQLIIIEQVKAGGLQVDQAVYLQRSDISTELAEKISTILTTRAKLKGRELTPKERQTFFKVFINNNPQEGSNMNRDRIMVNVLNVLDKNKKTKEQRLSIEINGEELSEDLMYTEEGKQLIFNHLMNARPKFVKKGQEEGSAGYWPANIQFNEKYNGGTYIDYTVEGEIIKENPTKRYWDMLKELDIKIEYSPESLAFEQGLNAYLNYAIPEAVFDNEDVSNLKVARAKTYVPKKRSTTPKKQDVEKYKSAPKTRAKKKPSKPRKNATNKEKEEVKKKNVKQNPSISDQLNFVEDIMKGNYTGDMQFKRKGLDRSKLRDRYLDRVFTSKADKAAAEKWWANSPLNIKNGGVLTLERITEIVNSDAFATWSGYGITLYEADGGTSIDVYHEAWHGFSQLFLSVEEKTKLYEEIQGLDKYKDKSFEDIEEDLAEQFRSYAKSKGKKKVKGLLGRIFDNIYTFLQKLFGKATKKEVVTNLQDLESVKELFDNLYRASENPDILAKLKPSMNNVMFSKLNRSKTINDSFSLEESKEVVEAIDSIMAQIFQQFNEEHQTTTAALELLRDDENKKILYKQVYDKIERLRLGYVNAIENNQDLLANPEIVREVDLLGKIISNYGSPTGVFDLNEDNNVIKYHTKKSIFKVLRDQYEEIEDPSNIESSNLFKLKDNTTVSAKKLANQETMMLLASVFEVTRENGEVVPVRGLFNLPKLQSIDKTWSRLAKILEGSFDEMEMYTRLFENSENYPELQQLQKLLPNPFFNEKFAEGKYTALEFELETSFWQDFKKPRVPWQQLNLNPEVVTTDGQTMTQYEARLSRANFDVYQVLQDWKYNFITADTLSNKYITKQGTTNLLNTERIVKDFGINGEFNFKKGNEFLRAIGVQLDENSPAIEAIIKSKENPFALNFGLDVMYDAIKQVNAKKDTEDALKFRKNPIQGLQDGLPESLRKDKKQNEEVRGRFRALAEIQNAFSDGYSNFSVQTPEGTRVWEHIVDSTVTRIVAAINAAENWQELTDDPNGRFKHMRWLAFENNTFSPFSKLLGSIFDLNPQSEYFGQKFDDVKLTLSNVGGTQLIENYSRNTGTSTASMDATSKYLQEIHTMLLSGVEEFMRHASKNTAMSMSLDGEIKTYNDKNANKLYVDIESFVEYANGEVKGYDIVEGYLAAEANRIVRFKQNIDKFKNYAGYNREVRRKDNPKGKGTKVYAGEAFTAFDDILTEQTQKELYEILDEVSENKLAVFNLMDRLELEPELRDRIRKDVKKYFNLSTQENLDRLQEAKYVDEGLIERIRQTNKFLSDQEIEKALVKAYTYNSFIHKMETVAIAYGDLVQYNHAKEEFHKRNAGLAAGGKGFRADARAQIYLSSLRNYYAERRGKQIRNYDGTLNTAIIKEMELPSEMYKEYIENIEEDIYNRTKNRQLAKDLAKKAAKEYTEMKIADGQGWITFETYRLLKKAEANWSDMQEALYRKVSLGENITQEDVIQFFPSYKLQYFGNIESEGLPVNSFHKFSLAPIIPGVAKEGTPLFDLHERMMDEEIDYALMESGSKVSHIGTGDVVFNEDGSFNKESKFTINKIYVEFLKNQTEVNSTYKEKSIFSTQLRKLILEGLYKRGVIESTNYEEITNTRVKRYIDHVEEYTELLKLELLEEMGYEETSPGEYKPISKASTAKLLNMIRQNLEREDVLNDDLIEFIDVFEGSGDLVHDLSFHPEAGKIEKLILSMINKRVIKQKVSGEPLVQVSVGMYANQFTKPNLRKATKDEIAKWGSASYLLPTYHKKSNGYTAAAKVMIAMQGTYYNLFNLEYENGESIGVYNENDELQMDQSLKRLNEKIKDDAWLDANDGANRKAITLVGVRIPVQGLNSMEFAEVFEFLPPQAGNIIIPPAEIVAKSGGDFDIDKLTIFMNTLNEDGSVIKRGYKDLQSIKDLRGTSEFIDAITNQKYALENELINDIKEILELPDNYSSLVMPNGIYLLKGIADELSKHVSKYNPKATKMTKDNIDVKTGDEIISPTRVLESLYNVYKHESNIVGKKTLGLGAVENTFNVILNALGAYMPDQYLVGTSLVERTSNMRLKHNKMTDKNGNEVISMSDIYDVDGINKVADVISQMMNGWVDVEKDAWIFFIQGNYEVAPTLLYMVKAGVPVEEAIYFVSNPLVREYVTEQRLAKSTYAEVLGKKPTNPGLAKYAAASEVIKKYFKQSDLSSRSKNEERYLKGQELLDKYFEKRKQKSFTLKEMKDLVEDNDFTKKKLDQAKAMFLHYLELEQQIAGYTALKMSSNPDTSTKTTISDVEQTEANIAELFYDSKVPVEIVEAMMDDSILKSFFNGPLALAVSRPLFKLRYHKEISNYLISRKSQIRIKDLPKTFPGRNLEMFSNVFRNDIVSYILQNAIRKYQTEPGFMSLDLETKIPTSMAKSLNRGAFVKNGVLYMDMKQLKKEFENEAWTQNSDVKNSYEDRGLYPLKSFIFKSDSSTSFNEYIQFVSYREYFRSVTPMSKEYVNTYYFQQELELTKEQFPELPNEKAVRYTYEKLLAIKALDSSYNFKHIFQDQENAFAIRMEKLLADYTDLQKNYPVLAKLKQDSVNNNRNKVFNLYIADKDFDNDKSNLFTNDLKALANPGIPKVEDRIENQRISDMFKFLNMYAFLQTGLNKTKLNFTNLVDFSDFLTIVESESDAFIEALEDNGTAILDTFYERFIKQNSIKNNNSQRFKNYLFDIDLKTVKKPNVTEKGFKLSIDKKGKDQGKADLANHFIGYGVPNTSTYKYEQDARKAGIPINYEGTIDENTIAFVSVNGNNKASEEAIFETIENAREVLEAGGTVIMDSTKDANRSWNKNGEALVQEGIGDPTGQTSKGYNYWGRNPEAQQQAVVDSTNMDTEVEEKRLGLKSTDNDNIFTYNDKNYKNVVDYTTLTENNTDVFFLHNSSIYESKEEQKEKGTIINKSAYFMQASPAASINFPTDLFSEVRDNQKIELDPKYYNQLKEIWENRIAVAQEILERDGKLAFPEEGFGDKETMPQELFVYLSKRLFEVFQYVNPGSVKYDQIMELVNESQGISDEEILLQLELEEDPFKCV